MSITVVGLLEADLPGATEYKSGGIGPLFAEERTEEPLSLDEFLSRIGRVLRKTGITSVVSVFVDEKEAYVDWDAASDNLDSALDITRGAVDLEDAASFFLMLSHEDDELAHVITVEGSIDHPADEAALSILDTARFAGGVDEEDENKEEGDEPGGAAEEETGAEPRDERGLAPRGSTEEALAEPLRPIEDDVSFFDDSALEAEELIEAFLRRFLGELEKELGVSAPEIDVWTDWQGEYGLQERASPGSLPGVTG